VYKRQAGCRRSGTARSWPKSEATIVLEGNHYFPPESIDRRYFNPSSHRTVCPWKGRASYYAVEVGGERNDAAAWYYPDPSPAAARIKDHVAFWHGVRVIEAPDIGEAEWS
jgi:uncharacterized protein (DUF427 family)